MIPVLFSRAEGSASTALLMLVGACAGASHQQAGDGRAASAFCERLEAAGPPQPRVYCSEDTEVVHDPKQTESHGGLCAGGPDFDMATSACLQRNYFSAGSSLRASWCATPSGKLHGPYREFYPNGAVAVAGLYRDQAPAGRWTEWTSDGKLFLVREYARGGMRLIGCGRAGEE